MASIPPNPIDLAWTALDRIVWDLMGTKMKPEEAERVRAYALGAATVVARFYGNDLEWVREESVRRYDRERLHPTWTKADVKIPSQRKRAGKVEAS